MGFKLYASKIPCVVLQHALVSMIRNFIIVYNIYLYNICIVRYMYLKLY